jgi:hypothetical protein
VTRESGKLRVCKIIVAQGRKKANRKDYAGQVKKDSHISEG